MWWLRVEGPTATSKSPQARSCSHSASVDTIASRTGEVAQRPEHAGQTDLLRLRVPELPHGRVAPSMFDVRRTSIAFEALYPHRPRGVVRNSPEPAMPGLLDPVAVGDLRLPNRVFMAPLTRCRAVGGLNHPTSISARSPENFWARLSICSSSFLTEATSDEPMGVGGPRHAQHLDTPIFRSSRIARLITEAVHARGGHIFLEILAASRRMSDPDDLDRFRSQVAKSALAPPWHDSLRPGTIAKQILESPPLQGFARPISRSRRSSMAVPQYGPRTPISPGSTEWRSTVRSANLPVSKFHEGRIEAKKR